jgi:hypothetical protein
VFLGPSNNSVHGGRASGVTGVSSRGGGGACEWRGRREREWPWQHHGRPSARAATDFDDEHKRRGSTARA